MTSRCVTGMRTADKHFPARVFRTMQKQPTTQPTPLTSSLGISPHLAASLGFWFGCWSSEKPGSNLACNPFSWNSFISFIHFSERTCFAIYALLLLDVRHRLSARSWKIATWAAFWAAVWPMRQLWPSRLRFPRQFPGSPAHLKLRFPFQRPNTERHLPSLA